MTVTAEIDVTRRVGRKLVREMEGKDYINIKYPSIQKVDEKKYTLQEVFERGEKFLNEYYGSDLKLEY